MSNAFSQPGGPADLQQAAGAPKKKEGAAPRRVVVVVVGASGMVGWRHFLLGIEEQSRGICAVRLTGYRVAAEQFQAGQRLECVAGRDDAFDYGGTAPCETVRTLASRPRATAHASLCQQHQHN